MRISGKKILVLDPGKLSLNPIRRIAKPLISIPVTMAEEIPKKKGIRNLGFGSREVRKESVSQPIKSNVEFALKFQSHEIATKESQQPNFGSKTLEKLNSKEISKFAKNGTEN